MARRAKSISGPRAPVAQVNWYKRQLRSLLEEIANSFTYWVGSAYRKHEDKIVGDASPQVDLQKAIKKNVRQWRTRLNTLSEELSEKYITRLDNHTKRAMLAELKKQGFIIDLKLTPDLRTAFKASVEANAGLIRNLADDYLAKAQGIVWRGVQNGADLPSIKKRLIAEVGIEERRAARIAVDQANKATQSLTTERAKSIGVTEAYWQHNTGGSKTYRTTHLEFDNERFYIVPVDGNEAGLYDSDVGFRVMPAELPFCKCSYRIILPGQ